MGTKRFSGMFLMLFVGIWTALLAIGGSFWLYSSNYQQYSHNFGRIVVGRGFDRAIGTATNIAQWNHKDALVAWLKSSSNTRPEVFAVNANGVEITGKPIPTKAWNQYRENPNHPGIRVIELSGEPITLFSVWTNTPPRNPFFALLSMPVWLQIVLMLFFTSLVAGLLAWQVIKPIRKLSWAMRRATEGDLSVRVAREVGHRHDEIGELAQRYDRMAETINGLLARQKRLFHDVSHELRSPLARIEVAIAIAGRNPERRSELLDRIEREIHVLDNLVDELLTYARLDDNAPMAFEPTDVVPLLEEIVDNSDFEGSSRGVHVRLDAPGQAFANLHIDSLGRAIENVVRNALRFSPDHSEVLVRAGISANNRLVITVRDHGPGMSQDDLERLFLPFVRGSDQKTGSGFGLGLAIAKRATERHGGTITARNCPDGGLMMVIDLPLLLDQP